jgi:signal peptidase II
VRALRGGSRLADVLIVALVVLDRATKAWARGWLAAHGPVKPAPFFWLNYVENTGAAFGLGRGSNAFFVALALALIGALIVWRRRLPADVPWTRLALSLVLAGAVGNLYDRVAYGFVVDFLDFRVWPVFNVADSAISVGACILAATMWFEDRKAARR